mgnify:CR=1 FL=1|jgi:hypothetical protein|tara:strand:+ start:8996 stop:9226 length:231 start_codon:yes stop_codon:yes gene_type:complete
MKNFKLISRQIVYSEHGYDECFEYKDGAGRVPDGLAIGYEFDNKGLVLFRDIKYSEYDHKYWDNYELELDVDRIII